MAAAPVLARLEAHAAVRQAFLSTEGTQILLEGSSVEGLLAASEVALEPTKMRPEPQGEAEARAAWEQRADWVGRTELWRLSWREAETFADRLLVELEGRFGEGVKPLRPLLVESFFEGVRPQDGSGPLSRSWERGATVEARRAVILARAAELLELADHEALGVFLSDAKAVRAATRNP